MNAREVAAKFAAYLWFENVRRDSAAGEEIAQFARENWQAYLPLADDGAGRLLIRLAGPRKAGRRPIAARRRLVAARAGCA